jgi:hypothetical protein
MECSAIRIYLHHYKQDEKVKVNDNLKRALKERKFKWLSLKNEATQRIEILECKGPNQKIRDPVSLTLNMRESQQSATGEPYSEPLLLHASFSKV